MSSHRKTSRKLLASAALLAGAAGVAGLGTYGSFTSTTSASASVEAGTVKIALGAKDTAANRLTVAAAGLVPGDTVQRAVTLTNSGTQGLAEISLTTSATTTSILDTDKTDGLQVKIESCTVPWTEAGATPVYTYTCSGTTRTVLEQQAIIGANLALQNLDSRTKGGTDNLRVTTLFPTTADDRFQGKSSTINFTFTGTQRAGVAK